MKTAKALLMATGLVMASGSAMAGQRVDEDDLLGTWDATMEGPGGEATLRVVMVENGTYLSLGIVPGEDEPFSYWEVGEWEVDGDEITFTPVAASEGASLEQELATVEDLDDGVLLLSSDKMEGELEFTLADNPVVGTWEGETEEGAATFLMSCDGGFAASLGEGRNAEVVWGTWEQDGDDITFTATEEAWAADGEPQFETHEGEVEDADGETLTMSIEGLGDEAIEWERMALHPIIGEWTGIVDDGTEITMAIDEEGTFEVSAAGEDQVYSGIWTIIEGGRLVMGIMVEGEGGQVESLQFVLTSPDTAMFGQNDDEMAEFTRE